MLSTFMGNSKFWIYQNWIRINKNNISTYIVVIKFHDKYLLNPRLLQGGHACYVRWVTQVTLWYGLTTVLVRRCNVDESGNFQKPLKITSWKRIYLQIEKKYIQDHTHSHTLSHISLKRTYNWINQSNYNFTTCNMFNHRWQTDKRTLLT